MKKVILIMGHLASGKSTITKKLSSKLNLRYFCKDDIKEILAEEIGFTNREENVKLSKATFKLLSHSITALEEQGIILLESNFKDHELRELKETHPDVLFETIFLTGKQDILFKRFTERQKNRHFAHKSTGEISYKDFANSMFEYEPNILLGNSHLIDTTTFEGVIENIEEIILGFLEK